MVDPKPLKAALDGIKDVPARIARIVGAGAHCAEHLGGDDHVLAPDAEVLQRLPDHLLRGTAGIDIGGVDEVDAMLKRSGDQRLGLTVLEIAHVGPIALAAKGHGAEAEFGDEQASIAECLVTHCASYHFLGDAGDRRALGAGFRRIFGARHRCSRDR